MLPRSSTVPVATTTAAALSRVSVSPGVAWVTYTWSTLPCAENDAAVVAWADPVAGTIANATTTPASAAGPNLCTPPIGLGSVTTAENLGT